MRQRNFDDLLPQQQDESALLRSNTESLMVSIITQGLWENESVVEDSLNRLRVLCDYDAVDCENNRTLAHDLGAHSTIVKIMEQHSRNRGIQQCCCEVLSLISLSGCEGEILQVGGLERAIDAMEYFSDAPDIQESACALIALMIDEDSMGLVVRGGGLDATVAAMKHHQNNPTVQNAGCYVLHVLLEEGQDQAARMIANAGGIDTVLGAMNQHRDADLVQIEACKILCKMAEVDENCRSRIINANGLGAVVETTKVHHENSDVMSVAVRTLKALLGQNHQQNTIPVFLL